MQWWVWGGEILDALSGEVVMTQEVIHERKVKERMSERMTLQMMIGEVISEVIDEGIG